MSRKQHGDVRNGGIGKDRDFRGQRLSQKYKERFSESGEKLVAGDAEYVMANTKLYKPIRFLLGLLI